MASSVIAPRRVSAIVQSPSAMPSVAASRGCISMRGSGYWFDQRPDAAGLRARQELAHDAAGREEDRVLRARVVDRRTVVGDVEARPAVGKVERPAPLATGL